jgi:plastocyanin
VAGMKRLALLAGLVVLLAGCGGKSGGSNTAAAPSGSGGGQTIQVKETEYKLTPSSLMVSKPGTVTVEVTNAGQIDHALEVEGNGVEEETETISPGSSAKLTVDLSKNGTYEVYCPIDGHRSMGMEAKLVVGSGSGSGGGTTTTETKTKSSGGYGY